MKEYFENIRTYLYSIASVFLMDVIYFLFMPRD